MQVQKSVFTELRILKAPPEAIKKLLKVYAGMYNIDSQDFNEQRNKLCGPNAHVILKNYDVENISMQTL